MGAVQTAAFGAERKLILDSPTFRFCPFCDIPEAALRTMPSG